MWAIYAYMNYYGTYSTKYVLLSIVPSIVLSTPSNMSIQEGSTFNISFEYYAVPLPNSTWYINDEFYETVTSHGTHTIVFTDVTLSQRGWYHSVVENEFGSYNYTTFVEIFGNTLLDYT